MTAVTLNEAKEDLEHLIEKVIADAEPAIVCTDSGERAVLMSQGSMITAADVGLQVNHAAPARLEDMSIEDVESFLIRKALTRYSNNVSQAATALGLSRSALYRRMQRYGI